jgi:thymidylate synthase (FAD)
MKAEILSHMGDDLTVVNAARVSFDKQVKSLGSIGTDDNQIPVLHDRDKKLIKYLARHKHLSPFGHCFVSFRITCPIFVSRQLVKHSYLRINEVSRRYVSSEPEIYYPDFWRSKAEDKKQGSGGSLEYAGQNTAIDEYSQLVGRALRCYDKLLQAGVAEEQARMCLPQSAYTQFYWSGSLDAFAKMCVLRCAEDAQAETRVIANQISNIMSHMYPVSWEALTGNDWMAKYLEKV